MTAQMSTYSKEKVYQVDENTLREHLPMVRKIAHPIAARAPASIVADDLVGAGSLGLMDSLIRNHGDEGAAFTCYARMRIKGAIYDEMRTSDWLPRRNRNQQPGDTGPARPIAVIRFDDLPPGQESHPQNKEPESNPFDMLDSKREKEKLRKALGAVPKRDRLILHLHYFRGMQIREIGRFLGISEARISQIHHRALTRIRPLLEAA